jgi:hypothetical protein
MQLKNGSFEDGLAGWTVGRDLPADPNAEDDESVDSRVSVSDERASDGRHSCALFVDGRQASGAVWVQQAVDLGGFESLAVDYYSDRESFNIMTKAAVYAGPAPETDLTAADFDMTRAVETHEGWQTYEFPLDHDGSGLVAVGVEVVWETEVTRYVDDVHLA